MGAASVGVAEFLADDVEGWPELVELADKRMYEAKAAGKARCVLPGGTVLLPQSPAEEALPLSSLSA